jgi:hypothetical protein
VISDAALDTRFRKARVVDRRGLSGQKDMKKQNEPEIEDQDYWKQPPNESTRYMSPGSVRMRQNEKP